MDEFHADAGELPDEYAALGDARQVMLEVVPLVEDLHRATTRLGDAIAAAGFHSREWRGPAAELDGFSDQFPAITLDDLITRLAEFSAGNGPLWLHGDRADIERFNDEAAILAGVVRPLRVLAQRQRVLPARERSRNPLERALADGGVSTQLDLMARYLRDLEALSPFIAPLAPEEWGAPQPERASVAQATSAAGPRPAMQPFTRLRDFAGTARQGPSNGGQAGATQPFSLALERARSQTQALVIRLRVHRWAVVAIVAVVLAIATGLVSLTLQQQGAQVSASHLRAAPVPLTLACSGKSATLALTLRNTGSAPLTWQVASPAGLSLSATNGLLTAGASATITVRVSAAKAAHGTLAFTSSDGAAQVPYTVTCSK